MEMILTLPGERRINDPRTVKLKGAEKREMRGSSDFKTGRAKSLMLPSPKETLNSLPGGRIKNDG